MASGTGRADILRVLEAGGEPEAARVFDYAYRKRQEDPNQNEGNATSSKPTAVPEVRRRALLPAPMLYPSEYRSCEPEPAETLPPVPATALDDWLEKRPRVKPQRRLLPRTLDRLDEIALAFRGRSPNGRIDYDATVARIARLETLTELPRRSRPAPPDRLNVITSTDRSLIPFRWDCEVIRERLPALFPDTDLAWISFSADDGTFCRETDEVWIGDAPPMVPTLLLGDPTGPDEAHLRDFGQALRRRRLPAIALSPSPIDTDLASGWQTLPLDPAPRPSSGTDAALRRLMTFAAPATRIEPSLLRALRLRFLPNTGAWLERLFWQSNYLTSDHPTGATLRRGASDRFREAFETGTYVPGGISDEDRGAALEIIWSHHEGLPVDIYLEEVLALGPEAARWLLYSEDQDAARRYFQMIDTDPANLSLEDRVWLKRIARRIKKQEAPFRFPELRDVIRPIMQQSGEDDALNLPLNAPTLGDPIGLASIQHRDGWLEALPPGRPASGSLLAMLPSDNGVIEVEDPFAEVWGGGGPPDWVADYGIDDYGKWASFEIGDVVQTLRWIPPERFLMGSPEEEPGRYVDEGPQVEITFAEGYWLMDTAVTQALWQAVMEGNPSQFKGAERPVETIRWEDARGFIDQINARLGGLVLRLPSEAEWEYACRAGTTTVYAFGEEARPENIQFGANETCDVKAKPPNGWGLYQMHGNVWEWCSDVWRDSHEGADATGAPRQASQQAGSRVLRGGSWSSSARLVRSALRHGFAPGDRRAPLGFRCAGGQVVSSSKLGPDGRGRKAELRPASAGSYRAERDQEFFSGRRKAVLTADGPGKALALPPAPFVIRTDRAELLIARMTDEDLAWANAGVGRDRFGLWSDIAIDEIRQRLRWIPPGQFLMGSPEDEPGRHEDEGPQVAITFAQGYWLFDTPVTQALWVAVTKNDNPSMFQSPDRPVDTVEYKDAELFIDEISDRLKDLTLRLPSEAEWEYACRSGTDTATYAGPMEILGMNNARVLDALAWYGGNCGRDFELKDGYDISGFQEKQYDDARGGTHTVAQKQPNAWGLYDMLGNVLEWCADAWSETHEGADHNGSPRQASQQDPARVIRGGSWDDTARDVRSALRRGSGPGYRDDFLGFRCAGGHVVSSSNPETAGARGEAEPRPAPAGEDRAERG